MADESEERAQQDVTAATEGYGGPVSDDELADVYLPEGQDTVQDTDNRSGASEGSGATAPDAAPDGSGTLEGSSGEPAIEPPD
jgi:hypothetical protein